LPLGNFATFPELEVSPGVTIEAMLHRFVLHNDDIRGASESVFSAGQVGTLMGWGVFTTFRVTKGGLFAFDRHWARMKRDAELLRVPFPSDPEWVYSRLLRLIDANECSEATMRLCVVKNTGTVFTGPGIQRAFDLVAMTTNLANWGESMRLGVVPNGRFAASPYSRTKVLSWAFNLNWYQQAHELGFDEVVLLNERGEVAECTSANIFAVFGDEAVTPPLDSGCLPGITREILLQDLRVPGVRISERTLMPRDLESADEVFVTSTTRNVLPVSVIDGLQLQGGRARSMQLRRAFESYIEEHAFSKVNT
jgi:branched-chain amino acid aminotransferase